MWQRYKYHALMHLIIFLWGFTGILGKLIHKDALHIVWYRVLIAFVALGLFLLYKGKDLRLSKKLAPKVLGVGLIVATHWMTFYYSIQLSTASLAILCLSTTTLHVSWLEPLVMKKKFSIRQLLMGLVVISGISFVSLDFSGQELLALFFGLFSALCAAFFSVFNAKLSEETSAEQLTFYEMIAAFTLVSIILLSLGKLHVSDLIVSFSDLCWLLFLGIVCTSFAFLATIIIVRKLGAFTVSLNINLEPIYTILLAIVLLNEHKSLSTNFYLGAAIIVLVLLSNGLIKHFELRKTSSEIG
ncbi:MAG: DMT family transporter [Crocinitomicaceae bacterium]|jgi:drug/metabolite transporter (DMT)-like permease|nr:DMT family transporter [Crocinitomicaceae bacterium]